MFCPKCGKQLPEGSIACNFCAAPIPQRPQTATYAENAPTYQPSTPPAPQTPPAPNKKKLWPWILLLAGLLVAAVVVGIFVFNDGNREDTRCFQLAPHFIADNFEDALEDITHITFTDEEAPKDAIDVSIEEDESVLAWLEYDGGDAHLFVTTADGKTLYAPEDCNHLFAYLDGKANPHLQAIDFDNFDTSKTTNMCALFGKCVALESLDVSNWDVSNVAYMSSMFEYCDSLESLDVSNWDVSNVTDMSYMFYSCDYLKSLDVEDWDVSNVTNMSYMFSSCPAPRPSWY